MNNKNNTGRGHKADTSRWGVAAVVIAVATMLLALPSHLEAKPVDECNWYLSAGAQGIPYATGSGPDVNLAGGVLVNGSTDYGSSHALNAGVGREFTLCNDSGRRTHLRLEAQYWDGYVHRNSVKFGVVNPALNDKVDFRALFLNGFIALSKSDKFGLWVGPGVGYAWTSFPDASYATPCGCLQPAKSEGLAFQVKLQGERKVYDKTSLFGEVGYVHFPGSQSSGVPGAHYGDVGMLVVGVGLMVHF